MNEILEGLNPKQKEAVECLSGPLLILAGAGSGKTRTLTHRIANLIAHGVKPGRILAVTFTNKAANEMKERLARLLGAPINFMPYMGTFHGICVKILRQEYAAAGIAGTSTFEFAKSEEIKRIFASSSTFSLSFERK